MGTEMPLAPSAEPMEVANGHGSGAGLRLGDGDEPVEVHVEATAESGEAAGAEGGLDVSDEVGNQDDDDEEEDEEGEDDVEDGESDGESDGASVDADGLTAYERQRQANIERNKKALEALGLLGGADGQKQPRPRKAYQKKVYERKEREGRNVKPPERLNPSDDSRNPFKKAHPVSEERGWQPLSAYAPPPPRAAAPVVARPAPSAPTQIPFGGAPTLGGPSSAFSAYRITIAPPPLPAQRALLSVDPPRAPRRARGRRTKASARSGHGGMPRKLCDGRRA